jgi:hypothetical protein
VGVKIKVVLNFRLFTVQFCDSITLSRRVSDEVFGRNFVEIFYLVEDGVTTVKLVGLGRWNML